MDCRVKRVTRAIFNQGVALEAPLAEVARVLKMAILVGEHRCAFLPWDVRICIMFHSFHFSYFSTIPSGLIASAEKVKFQTG